MHNPVGVSIRSNASSSLRRIAQLSVAIWKSGFNPLKRAALDAAGIVRGERTHGLHLFRHSAGSIIHAATGDLKLAQEQLRHTQISTTSDIYIHVEPNVAQRASDALAEEIFPNCAQLVPIASDLIQ